ncbi:MAG TPA: polysaccharide biosynthesis protein, partial [Devosia sp.]|nr:polysaccharide biosynthesis protein [Devosia sp.]
IGGTRIYPPGELANLIRQLGIQEVIICMPSLSAAKRQNIITDLSTHGIAIRSLPPLNDLASGRVLISQLHEVDIGDILGRSSVPADPELLDTMLNGRSILVTGAGGSIGSELCELIARWSPRKLILLEASEFMLYQIERKLKKQYDIPIVPILGSVSDEALVNRIFGTESVQAVFHAAAHKHVPLVEANALEGVRNNVFGTRTIARAAYEAGVEHFVLISSDKAVRPANVMGATKRWAELVIGQLARRAIAEETGQKFCSVRFGNVLASNGSVVPLFKEQIAQGGPVTITDNEMTRYFMSIHEAAELIVQAGALSQGGDTFILEMGEPMRIRDLAENMIRLSGATVRSEENPGGDIAITVIGRRPAEKLSEELFYDPDSVRPTRFPKILRAPGDHRINERLNEELEKLARALKEQNEVELRKILFEFLSGRQPGTGDAKIVPISRAKDAGT